MPNLIAFMGAWLYRLRGGLREGHINRTLTRILYWLPLAGIIAAMLAHALGFTWVMAGLSLTLAAICWLGVIMGHGSYMDLNGNPHLIDDEMLKKVLDLFYGRENSYGRDYAGLCITGLIVTLPVGIAAMIDGFYFTGLLMIASGAAKGYCYDLGQRLPNNVLPDRLSHPTEIGEVLFGLVTYNAAAIFVFVIAERLLNVIFN